MQIAGHELEFYDCREICQGGPLACRLLIGREQVEEKLFDASPLPYRDGLLVPVRVRNILHNGYALYYIPFDTLDGRVLSKVSAYMGLSAISGDVA